MTQIISCLHSTSVDFLKKDENRKNLLIAAGMPAAALTLAAIAAPLFPSLCISGIVGIVMGLITNEMGKTLLKILG